MLRACLKTLKPGGLISFLVIAAADGLSAEQTARVLETGPESIAAEDGYEALMSQAGFGSVEIIDATDEYLVTLDSWIGEWDAESGELERLLGMGEFAERQTRRRRALSLLAEGLMRRYLISAERP